MSFYYMLIFILPCIIGKKSDLEPVFLHYVKLASDVQEVFGSSSVFIVNAGFYEDLLETMLMARMSKEFSRKYVLSQNINFTKLHKEFEYYNDKTVQPLYVIMLRTVKDLYRFGNATKVYNMGLHTWLVIFMRSINKKFNNYCRKPEGNLFNLVVSTKMIVKCYNDPLLKEWYSISGKTVDILSYGTWTLQRGVRKFSNENFYERRSDFKGMSLKVSAVKDASVISSWKGTMSGFFGIILEELARIMNFTIDFVSVENSYGNWNETNRSWTGVIGRLTAREIDVGIGEFTMSRQRAAVIDFTVPLMLTKSDIYIKRPNMSTVDWSDYFKAFHRDIWMIILIIVMVAPLLLAIIWKTIKSSEIFEYLPEEYLRVWGIYCQKSLPDFPVSSSLRIAYISIFMSSLVLFAVYSAYLTSYLTIFEPSIPFDTFEGFVADGTYKLIVLRHSSNHDLFMRTQPSILYKMGKFLKKEDELPRDVYTAIKQVCSERVLLFTNELFIKKISEHSPCELMPLTQGALDNVGLTLIKNSPYTEIFNYNLKKLRAFGITECLKRRYFKNFIYTTSNYLPVAFWEVIPVLGILCLGAVLSLAFLICEFITYKQREQQDITKRIFENHQNNGKLMIETKV